jgi:hypothetical protein
MQTTDIPFFIGEEQWLKLNRNALTCLVSASPRQAKNIVPSSAKMQGQRRPKSHAIAITLPAQNEDWLIESTRSPATFVDADSRLRNFGSESWRRREDTKAVRYYMIQVINGTTTFSCRHCNHSVTTLEFSIQNGSPRTQAARAMNEHAAAEHRRRKPMSASDRQVWHAH